MNVVIKRHLWKYEGMLIIKVTRTMEHSYMVSGTEGSKTMTPCIVLKEI